MQLGNTLFTDYLFILMLSYRYLEFVINTSPTLDSELKKKKKKLSGSPGIQAVFWLISVYFLSFQYSGDSVL